MTTLHSSITRAKQFGVRCLGSALKCNTLTPCNLALQKATGGRVALQSLAKWEYAFWFFARSAFGARCVLASLFKTCDVPAGSQNRFFGFSKLDHLRGANIRAGSDLVEQLRGRSAVEIQNRQRGAASLVTAERHGSDVDAVIA